MSLSHAIVAALDKGGHGDTIQVTEGTDSLGLDVVASSSVGVECRSVVYQCRSKASWTADDLRAWSDRVAARVTYLMEPLVVVETDAEESEVQMRSKTPTPRGQSRGFYEVRLNASGTLRLARVLFDEQDRRRRPATFQLTREVLERLADDLVASAR